jgi:hypothetical protein
MSTNSRSRDPHHPGPHLTSSTATGRERLMTLCRSATGTACRSLTRQRKERARHSATSQGCWLRPCTSRHGPLQPISAREEDLFCSQAGLTRGEASCIFCCSNIEPKPTLRSAVQARTLFHHTCNVLPCISDPVGPKKPCHGSPGTTRPVPTDAGGYRETHYFTVHRPG